jgi:hypothetical protein
MKKESQQSLITDKLVNKLKTDINSSYIGTLCFVDNVAHIIHGFNKHKVWNLNEVLIHTYGYPQMNASVNGIHTAYKSGMKFDFYLFKDEAYLSTRVFE